MSTISQIVALHKHAAQLARTPQAPGATDAAVRSAAALVTLGVARAPVTYTDRIKRPGGGGAGLPGRNRSSDLDDEAAVSDDLANPAMHKPVDLRGGSFTAAGRPEPGADTTFGCIEYDNSSALTPTRHEAGTVRSQGQVAPASGEAVKLWDGSARKGVGTRLYTA